MSHAGDGSAIPVAVLLAFGVYLAAQRAFELVLSARNGRRPLARGGSEHGREHFPMLVVMHTLFPLAIAAEVLALGARHGRLAPLWLTLWLAAQGLRWAAMWALGEHWNTRVIVVPGEPLVRRGPYAGCGTRTTSPWAWRSSPHRSCAAPGARRSSSRERTS